MQTQTKEVRVPVRRTPWLAVAREKLAETWGAETGHLPGIGRPDWASELMHACAETKGHLSLPCSIRQQANDIGVFLLSPSFDGVPALFFKLYAILLNEFTNQLRDVGGLMELDIGKPPPDVAVWANCWAKHSLSILVQHHPAFVFADELGPDWAKFKDNPDRLKCVGKNGSHLDPQIIDSDWLCKNNRCVDLANANIARPPVIVVPPLSTLLKGTMSYFREVVDEILSDPCRIQMFESMHHGARQTVLTD